MTQAFNLSQFANKLNSSGQTDNTGLQNSSVTVTAGTGMSGGGAVALGSSVTLNNAGVTSIAAGSGISVSGSTGAVTISSSGGGVTSLNGNTGALKGYDFISTGTFASSVSSVNITSIPSGYQFLRLIFQARTGTGGGSGQQLGIRVSTNGGGSYITTSSYSYGFVTTDGGGIVTGGNNNFSSSSIQTVTYGSGGPLYYWGYFVADFQQATANNNFFMNCIGGTTSNGADNGSPCNSNGGYNSTTYVNGLQVLVTNGQNMTAGSWTLYGAKNA